MLVKLISSLLLLGLIGCSSNGTYAPVVDAWHDPGAMKSRYRVQKDDTIYSIALGFDMDYRDLAKANHLVPPYNLVPGQTLTMQKYGGQNKSQDENPVTKVYAVKDIQPVQNSIIEEVKVPTIQNPAIAKLSPDIYLPEIELGSIHDKLSEKKQALAAKQDKNIVLLPYKTASVNQDKMEGQVNAGRWQWPAKGKVLREFSLQEGGNKGIDIAGNLGDPVRAVAPGKVVYSGSGLRGYGNLVIIKHSDNYLSAYAYNKRLLVKEGDGVKAGMQIGKMGQNDRGQVLLHFEIRRNGKPVNPLLYL